MYSTVCVEWAGDH